MGDLAAARASSAAAAADKAPLPFASNVAHKSVKPFFARAQEPVMAYNSDAERRGELRSPELLDALIRGDEKRALELVKLPGINVEFKGRSGVTPLMLASKHGYVDVVKALLEKGANVHAVDDNGTTVIEFPANRHKEKILQLTLRTHHNVALAAGKSIAELQAERDKYDEIIKLIVGEPMTFIKGFLKEGTREIDSNAITTILHDLELHPIVHSIRTGAQSYGYEPPSGGRRRYRSLHKTQKTKKQRARKARGSRNRKY